MRFCLFLFFIFFADLTSAQSHLFSVKSAEKEKVTDILSFTDPNTRTHWSISASKNRSTAYLFNDKVMLRDSLSFDRPETKYDFIAGYSLKSSGNPSVYWASADYSKVYSCYLDMKYRAIARRAFVFDYENESFLTSFSEQGRFMILTAAKDANRLICYDFQDGKPEMKIIDLSSFAFRTARGQELSLSKWFLLYPCEFIESDIVTPLGKTAALSKFYLQGDNLILSAEDGSTATRIFTMNLKDLSVSETKIAQQAFEKPAQSNSFIQNQVLYQFKANSDEMYLRAIDWKSNTTLKEYRATEKDTVSFRNSPFLIQLPDRITTLRDSKRFLRRTDGRSKAISIYRHRSGNLIATIGAVSTYRNSTDVILGSALGVGMIASGSYADIDGLFDQEPEYQTIFFEGLFDKDFGHLNYELTPIYTDALSRFLNTEMPAAYSLSKFGSFFILSYYSEKDQSLVLRKFSDSIILD